MKYYSFGETASDASRIGGDGDQGPWNRISTNDYQSKNTYMNQGNLISTENDPTVEDAFYADELGAPCYSPEDQRSNFNGSSEPPTPLPREEVDRRLKVMQLLLEGESSSLDLPNEVSSSNSVGGEIEISPKDIQRLAQESHRGDAEFIAILFRYKLLWDIASKVWRYYKCGVWVCDPANNTRLGATEHIKRKYVNEANRLNRELNKELQSGKLSQSKLKGDPRSQAIEEMRKKIFALNQKNHIDSSMNLCASMMGVAHEEFDKDEYLLNVSNGTLDLRTWRLLPHNPDDRMLKKAPASFAVEADCPKFKSFLDTIFCGDNELVLFVQRAVGYSLTGSVGADVLFFLYGSGSNGKSTFIEVIEGLFGDYFQKFNVEGLLMQGKGRDNAAESEKTQLFKARFVSVTELPEGRRLNEALVKDLTGGDTVTACAKYCHPISFRPTHKLWLFGNDKPVIKGTDDGIWRRIMLIPFNHQFPEQGSEGWKDKAHVLKELRSEMSGILNWALKGLTDYESRGLKPSSVVKDAVREFRSESDVLNEFIEDYFEIEEFGITTRSELWDKYQDFTRDDDRKAFNSQRALYRAMKARKFSEYKSSGIRGFRGLKLKD